MATYKIVASVVDAIAYEAETGFASTQIQLMNSGGFSSRLVEASNMDELRRHVGEARHEAYELVPDKCLTISPIKVKGRAAKGYNQTKWKY